MEGGTNEGDGSESVVKDLKVIKHWMRNIHTTHRLRRTQSQALHLANYSPHLHQSLRNHGQEYCCGCRHCHFEGSHHQCH